MQDLRLRLPQSCDLPKKKRSANRSIEKRWKLAGWLASPSKTIRSICLAWNFVNMESSSQRFPPKKSSRIGNFHGCPWYRIGHQQWVYSKHSQASSCANVASPTSASQLRKAKNLRLLMANVIKVQTMSGEVGSFCSARVLRRHGLGCSAAQGKHRTFQ